jgi:hypothetical protein
MERADKIERDQENKTITGTLWTLLQVIEEIIVKVVDESMGVGIFSLRRSWGGCFSKHSVILRQSPAVCDVNEFFQTTNCAEVTLVIQEQSLFCAPWPEIHGMGEQSSCDWVDTKKVALNTWELPNGILTRRNKLNGTLTHQQTQPDRYFAGLR